MFLNCLNLLRKSAFVGMLMLSMWACSDNDQQGGDEYFKQGEYEQAVEAYSQNLKMDPNNVNLLYSRGRAYEEMGNYDAAMEDFQTALKSDDRNVRVLIAMGDVLYKQEKYDNALYYYEQATNYAGNHALALFKEGRAHHKLGNVKEAMENYDAAIRENESLGQAYLFRGALKVSQKNNRAACEDFLKAQSLNVEEAGEALAKYCN